MRVVNYVAMAAAACMASTMASAVELGDPAAGEGVFRTCAACHAVDQERNRVGPHLINMVGRTAGTVEGFRYSPAMIEFGASGNVWTADNLAAYLASPRSFIRGNRMAFAGLRDEQQIADILAYLEQFSETTFADVAE